MNVYHVSGSYSENRHEFFKPHPRASFLQLPSQRRKSERERKKIVDSGASLHMVSKSDLTTEEQETIQKSKDPSDTMTASGTIHTTEEAMVCVCDADMFIERITRGAVAVKLWEEKRFTRMNDIQVNHHISSRMGETSSVKPTTTFPWWSHACKQPNTRPKLWATGNRHNDHERVETELPEKLEPLKD